MKRILAALDPDNFYRLIIEDEAMERVCGAYDFLQKSPYEGELYVHIYAIHLNTKENVECKIVIRHDGAYPFIYMWHYGDENLLEYGDDLMTIPDIFLTRRFRLMQNDAEKYLSQVDLDLIETWEELRAKKQEN